MKPIFNVSLLLALGAMANASEPIVGDDLVFEEVDGLVAVEAEHFSKQTKTEKRAWILTSPQTADDPVFEDDADEPHFKSASGAAYLECLPDTRHNHDHKLIHGENFSNRPGVLAILEYKIHFNTPGRYYVWVRAFSTGTEDNGIHVGLDGEWPESGQRLQWCKGKHTWRWESMQRTEAEHCGEPYRIFLDIDEPGLHRIQFSQREDGFEFDRFILTTDREFERPEDAGPPSRAKSGKIPDSFVASD